MLRIASAVLEASSRRERLVDATTLADIANAEDAATAAGMWWAAVLTNPSHDNGGTDEANLIAKLMAGMLAARSQQDKDALEAFALCIREYVVAQLATNEWGVSLSVDYHPDFALANCAEMADLSTNMGSWPWKTHMSINASKVTVSEGHGAPRKVIWEKKPSLEK